MKRGIEHLVVAHPDAASWVPYAQKIARELYANVVESGRKLGSKRLAVDDNDQKVYIDIRVQTPNVWILLGVKQCPAYVSGLYWIKDFFNPTVTVDGVARFRTLFPRKTPTVEVDQGSLASTASTDQLLAIRGSMYSGEMRKVVQVLMGMGAAVPYDYRASTTHGVFVGANGLRWILKISSEGLVAYLMTMCRGKNTPKGLGYTPIPTAEPATPRVLLTAEQLAAIMKDKGPFYASCGWAFSANGHKIANCLVGSESIYSYSWQYEITITENIAGGPIAATYSILKDGYIHGPRLTHMKYPTSDNIGLYSFDPYRGNANYVKKCMAPVFCYYAENTLETWFYSYDPAGDDQNFGPGFGGFGSVLYCREYENVFLRWGDYIRAGQPAIRKSPSFSFSNKNDTQTALTFRRGEEALVVQTYNPDNGTAWAVCVQQDQYTYYAFKPVTGVETSVLIVPSHDREACYVAKAETNQNGGFHVKHEQAIWEYQTLQFEKRELCDVTASTTPVTIEFIGMRPGLPSASCDSGLRMTSTITEDFGFPLQVSGIFQTTYQATAGQTADCTPVDPLIPINFPANQYTVPISTVITYGITLEASGGVKQPFSIPDSDVEVWMRPIDGIADQMARVQRDAFTPTRGAYTKLINKIYGSEMGVLMGLNPYILAPIEGSSFGFVGRP